MMQQTDRAGIHAWQHMARWACAGGPAKSQLLNMPHMQIHQPADKGGSW